MPQRTLVVKLAPPQRTQLKARLSAGDFEWRQVPHAEFSVKGGGMLATLYTSGKLVIQGADPETFLALWTDLEPGDRGAKTLPHAHEAKDAVARLNEPTVGCDETGKGDYFGPLVVAAVRLEPAQARQLAQSGVMDSKKVSDPRVLRMVAAMRDHVEHAIERLDPPEYNLTYPRYSGLNPMLADLHARAIERVAKRGDRVLIDQFAGKKLMGEACAHFAGDLDLRLEQAPRAERNVAVASASLFARAEFLLALGELSERHGIELRKGAGPPTDQAGLAYARRHGFDALDQVAKLHFKNTAKIEAAL
jgi:ribonuclease HIII